MADENEIASTASDQESMSDAAAIDNEALASESDSSDQPIAPLTPATVLNFLAFDGGAVRSIIASPGAIWLAAALVLTGALARNYDTEYLIAEPHHLLGSYAMSLFIFLAIFVCTWLSAGQRLTQAFNGGRARAFLTLFWMTSPVAWLYAVPYERLLTPADAVVANMWTLAIVSVWRVTLLSYAGSVLFGTPRRHQAAVTIMISAGAMFVALLFTNLEIAGVMGGVQLTAAERTFIQLASLGQLFCFLAFCVACPIALWTTVSKWQEPDELPPAVGGTVSRNAWLVAAIPLLVFAVALPETQREQHNALIVDELLKKQDYDAAVAIMNQTGSLPPAWFPSKYTVAENGLNLYLRVLETAQASDSGTDTVRVYSRELKNYLTQKARYGTAWGNIEGDFLARWLSVLEKLPAREQELLKGEIEKLKRPSDSSDDNTEPTSHPPTSVSPS